MSRAQRVSDRPAVGIKDVRRVRRSAADARCAILDVAEHKVRELGLDGLRLQQIAGELGLSHPAVLYHFGTREKLIEAVVERAFAHLEHDLAQLFAERALQSDGAVLQAIEQVSEALVKRGHGRILAWLLLSGHVPDSVFASLQRLLKLVHQARRTARPEANIALDDTRFRVWLIATSMLGESVAGVAVQRSLGLPDASARKRFHSWFASILLPLGQGPLSSPGSRSRATSR